MEIHDGAYRLGAVYKRHGWYDKAVEWYGQALAGEKALGADHPSTLFFFFCKSLLVFILRYMTRGCIPGWRPG